MIEGEIVARRAELGRQIKSGANWFYWIGVLSLVNSIISLTGSKWSFIIGLGITQVVDAVANILSNDIGEVGRTIGFSFNLLVAGVFVVFGFFSNKRAKWGFIIGMTLYAVDGLIFMVAQDWLSIGFHIFALIGIFSGLKANRELAKLELTSVVPIT